jgi:hypothetical protein
MTRRVHYEVEVGYDSLYQPACENAAGRDAIADVEKPVEMTADEAEVTCRRCLKALGYDAVPADQLTACEPDPIRKAA